VKTRVADPDWIRIRIRIGSVFGSDPDSIGSVDPDPDSESGSGSGSRRAKMTHKSRTNYKSSFFEVLDGLFCNLDVLYGGLGIGFSLFDPKKVKKNFQL